MTLGLPSQLLSVVLELYLSNALQSGEIHRLLPRKEFCRVGVSCDGDRRFFRKAARARALEEVAVQELRPGARAAGRPHRMRATAHCFHRTVSQVCRPECHVPHPGAANSARRPTDPRSIYFATKL